jgi:hemolysin D
MVENKDIGFINNGQVAEVKVEAFPFTRYGTLEGKVVNVSLDAVADEKRGLLYQTRVLLNKTWISVEGKRVALVPGMAVSVEIRTGRRKVIDYFLSPILEHGNESIRER